MKIIIAIPCLLKGGTEFQTLHLVKVLSALGYSIQVLVYFEYDKEMKSHFKQEGAEVHCLNWDRALRPWLFILKFRTVLKKLQPDVVHVQYMAPGALPIIAARLAGIKTVLATVHQPYTKGHGKLAKLVLKCSAQLCTKFMAVSKAAEQSWFGSAQLYNPNLALAKLPKHFTIYNTVDVELIQEIYKNSNPEELKKELGIHKDKRIIGAVSRLRREKGIDLIIKAFKSISETNPKTHLLLVGDGPDARDLRSLVNNYDIQDRVSFVGEAHWEAAMKYMAIMDIVVMPSRFEGFGLTAAEAMAMGKPVIASSIFGLKEVVQHKKTGLLFELENIAQLIAHCEILFDDFDAFEAYSQNALQYTIRHFDINIYSKNIKYLYKQISEWN